MPSDPNALLRKAIERALIAAPLQNMVHPGLLCLAIESAHCRKGEVSPIRKFLLGLDGAQLRKLSSAMNAHQPNKKRGVVWPSGQNIDLVLRIRQHLAEGSNLGAALTAEVERGRLPGVSFQKNRKVLAERYRRAEKALAEIMRTWELDHRRAR
jgi:hypothetical protein